MTELQAWVAAAEAAADVAGAVIRPFFRASLDATQKEDRSPVTIADRTAEQAMRAVLAERFPGHGILGEEFGLDRPEAALRWVLDPIDGTRAFITGRPKRARTAAQRAGVSSPCSWIRSSGRAASTASISASVGSTKRPTLPGPGMASAAARSGVTARGEGGKKTKPTRSAKKRRRASGPATPSWAIQ